MCDEVSGMKVLLLDGQTTGIVSIVYSQTEILQKEVFLVDRIDKKGREKLPHLKALVFIRPSLESIQSLVEELRDPRYKEYHVVFNNITRVVYIERIAEADQQAVVTQVHEYFADYLAITHDLASFNIHACIGDHLQSWDSSKFDRVSEGLVSLLLSLKKKPLVRYEKNSEMAKKLANELNVPFPFLFPFPLSYLIALACFCDCCN
jgi:vacuolar protein sorting-associated protein 45